jgi:REP element-mobilizing transposase RayT
MFTWRTYGTWLPGKEGFVGNYRPTSWERRTDNAHNQPTAPAQPALARYAAGQLRSPPVRLVLAQAQQISMAIQDHAPYRRFAIDAFSILEDHVHLVGWYDVEPDPDRALADWKAYASRALNAGRGRQNWWAEGGSKRWYPEDARPALIDYVRNQEKPLIVWLSDEVRKSLRL